MGTKKTTTEPPDAPASWRETLAAARREAHRDGLREAANVTSELYRQVRDRQARDEGPDAPRTRYEQALRDADAAIRERIRPPPGRAVEYEEGESPGRYEAACRAWDEGLRKAQQRRRK